MLLELDHWNWTPPPHNFSGWFFFLIVESTTYTIVVDWVSPKVVLRLTCDNRLFLFKCWFVFLFLFRVKIKGNSYKRTMSLQISHNTKASSAKIKRPYVKDVGCTPRWFFLNRPPSTSPEPAPFHPGSTTNCDEASFNNPPAKNLPKKKGMDRFLYPVTPFGQFKNWKDSRNRSPSERTKTPTLIFHPSMDTPTVLTILQPCFCITSSCCTAFLKDAKSRIHSLAGFFRVFCWWFRDSDTTVTP